MPSKLQYASDLHLDFPVNKEFKLIKQNVHNKADILVNTVIGELKKKYEWDEAQQINSPYRGLDSPYWILAKPSHILHIVILFL